MSYCRWSTDFFQCDVYVYAHVNGGWTTHVADRRLKQRPPASITDMPTETAAQWFAQHQAHEAWRDSLPGYDQPCNYAERDGSTRLGTFHVIADSEYLDLETIGAEAGETYSDPTPGTCADRLEALRATGFNVPQDAIDALRAEQIDPERGPR